MDVAANRTRSVKLSSRRPGRGEAAAGGRRRRAAHHVRVRQQAGTLARTDTFRFVVVA